MSTSVKALLIGGFLLVTSACTCPGTLSQPEELKPPPGQRVERTGTGPGVSGAQLNAAPGFEKPAGDEQNARSGGSQGSSHRFGGIDTGALDDRLRRLEQMSGQGGTDLEQASDTNIPEIPKEKQKRIELRFGGSLCPTCLVYFEKKLYETGAVVQVEMAVAKKRPGQLAKVAIATVDYDPTKINKAGLIELVKHNDFQFLQATDREVR